MWGSDLGPVVHLLAVAVEVVHRVISTIVATGDVVAVAAHLKIAHVLQLVRALARHLQALTLAELLRPLLVLPRRRHLQAFQREELQGWTVAQ